MEQPPHTSSFSAAPVVHPSSPVVQPSSPAAHPLLSSTTSQLGFSFAMAGESLLLQLISDVAVVSATTSIISLSHTDQVISLKLTNTNYLYWCMQMLSCLLG